MGKESPLFQSRRKKKLFPFVTPLVSNAAIFLFCECVKKNETEIHLSGRLLTPVNL